MDLSVGGMRIRSRSLWPIPVGRTGRIVVRSGATQFAVGVRVAHVRRLGLRSFDVGMQFLDLDPAIARTIETLARFGFVPRSAQAHVTNTNTATAVDQELAQALRVLGLAMPATPEQIHRAYRDLARRCHPDLCREPDAQTRFQQVHQAYILLRSRLPSSNRQSPHVGRHSPRK